jgi:adenylate cyclase
VKIKNVLLGLVIAVFFSLLYLLGFFGPLENQMYDLFLRVRRDRDRPKDIVFLDVDDNAIAYNGVFPWPRSITADALLRLKEYGARAAIFDIEYIDRGPQGVDTIYLNQGLPADFGRSFSEINSAASDIFSALSSRRLSRDDINEYSLAFSNLVRTEQNSLFTKAQSIARDNDQYLVQASALFGKSWATLNLRLKPLEGEQAERRPMAEERFSYPIAARANANKGKFIDILPALPAFAAAVKGAGFTNVEIDRDGTRRRIDLAQNIYDHWYLQLAFAPLIDYMGNPEIELSNRKLLIKNAKTPGRKDISVPLDGDGRMLLDWSREEYKDSYDHISFYEFSLLEDLEAELEQYSRAVGDTDIPFFAQFDSSLSRIPFIAADLASLFDDIREYRLAALENCSDDSFRSFIDRRDKTRSLIRELLAIDPGARIQAMSSGLTESHSEFAAQISDEAEYITSLAEALKLDLDRYETITELIKNKVKDKFCILGRVDTGTTDIGTNPFHAEYINVGTQGVVLDMILSETFITPVETLWIILFTLVFVSLFFLCTEKLAPIPRALSGFLIIIIIIAAAAGLFRLTGIFFSPLLAVFTMISAVILREIISYSTSEREKQFIRKALSTYVSGDVVEEIIADPSRLQLGGTKREMSAIFTDIQGFATISEKLDARQLVSLLNRYLTSMSDVILSQNGTIDKYEGDAIVAFFGAPVEMPDHAVRVCDSAITMKRIEADLNEKILEEKLSPAPLLTRIGINTGSMVAGNMGTENKMNYTIMGNAVNLASRLEGVNKQYRTWILVSEDTLRETDGRYLTRKLDRVRVVGIQEPVRIYELLDTLETADPQKKKLVAIFQQALDYYEKWDWKAADQGFRESLSLETGGQKDHNPSALYLERCRRFLARPPREDWDGVNNLTEK